MKLIFTLLTLLFCGENIQGYKVLYLFPFASKSHKNIYDALIVGLAEKNHEVTVVSTISFPKTIKNVKEIIIEEPTFIKSLEVQKQIFGWIGLHPLIFLPSFPFYSIPLCKSYFQNIEVKKLLEKEQQFDVVIVSSFVNECALGTAPLLGKQIISQSTGAAIPWSGIFAPQTPSYIPNIFLPYTSEINFFQRINNFLAGVGASLINDYYSILKYQSEIANNVPQNPSIFDARRKVTLYFTIADPVFSSPRPTMPNMISLGGIHVKNAKPLPQEFEEFVQSSGDDGFIYFSLGSNIQSKFLPDEIKKSLLNAFSKLKQKVIWKYEKEMKIAPSNVKVIKWAPQQDILGHPKIRGFITHGGLLSLQEATFNAVPVVAIPIAGDQPGNVMRAVELKIGVMVSFFNITAESIFEAVTEITTNKKYKDNMKKYSAIFRDNLIPPLERAISWIDKVVANEGVDHLKSFGEDLNVFQYFLVDVIAFISVIVLSVAFIFVYIGKLICKKCCFTYKKKSTSQKKKKK